jgi:hypothetical protein
MVFGVAMDRSRALRLRPGTLPARARIRGEFLRLLPGRGRLCTRDVLQARLRRALAGQHLAH